MIKRGDLIQLWQQREKELLENGGVNLTQMEFAQLITATMLFLLRNGRFISYDYKIGDPLAKED